MKKDNSFENAMNKIAGQYEAAKQEETRVKKRTATFGRVRKVFIYLCFATVLVVAYNYREKLTAIFVPKAAATQSDSYGSTAAALKTARQNAATRDSVIDSISK